LEGTLTFSVMRFGTSQSVAPDGAAGGTVWELHVGIAIQLARIERSAPSWRPLLQDLNTSFTDWVLGVCNRGRVEY